jgi:hypothetical protein
MPAVCPVRTRCGPGFGARPAQLTEMTPSIRRLLPLAAVLLALAAMGLYRWSTSPAPAPVSLESAAIAGNGQPTLVEFGMESCASCTGQRHGPEPAQPHGRDPGLRLGRAAQPASAGGGDPAARPGGRGPGDLQQLPGGSPVPRRRALSARRAARARSGRGLPRPTSRGPGTALGLGLVFGLALGPCAFAWIALLLGVSGMQAAEGLTLPALLLLLFALGTWPACSSRQAHSPRCSAGSMP